MTFYYGSGKYGAGPYGFLPTPFTCTLGDRAAMWGSVLYGATSGVVSLRWAGPFGAQAGGQQLARGDVAQVSYRQAAQLSQLSDPSWWPHP